METTKEMREFLIKQMQGVANGDVDATQGKAVCNFAQQIYNTVNLEIKYAVASEKLGDRQIESVEF